MWSYICWTSGGMNNRYSLPTKFPTEVGPVLRFSSMVSPSSARLCKPRWALRIAVENEGVSGGSEVADSTLVNAPVQQPPQHLPTPPAPHHPGMQTHRHLKLLTHAQPRTPGRNNHQIQRRPNRSHPHLFQTPEIPI